MKKIILYSTPSCVYCKLAKEFFKQNNIAYEEKNIALDEDAGREMVKKSGQMGVPVIDIDNKIIIGFDKGEIKEILGLV